MKTIYLAGGCFWGTQKFFDQFDGVLKTTVGYANGEKADPTYEEVCNDSGHAETVKLEYDENRISTRELLRYYFMVIDPTSVNRQGGDTGIQYRTGIYYEDESLLPEIRTVMEEEQKKYAEPLAVEVMPLQSFYDAEEYHQKYLDKNPGGYCHISHKLMNLAKEKLKVLIIYYTQSGNTQEIAKHIARGAAAAGAEVKMTRLKNATYEMLEDYDLIGFGTPTWKADTPNMHGFIDKLPDQKGKHCFAFNTHGTLPHLYFPIVIPNLKNHGLLPIGYKGWYGDVNMPGMPKPYYTMGHPDEQDFAEAEEFGKEMVINSKKIKAGDTSLIYPDPERNDKVFEQAMICSNMLLCPTNPQGAFFRDPEKCHYPQCHVCMDNCTMGYIDLSKEPQVFGNRGDRCDDCHECSYCFMICPFGAIYTEDPNQFEKDRGHRHKGFEKMLDRDEAEGTFRRHIPADEVGFDTPYVFWHPERPYLKVPKEDDEFKL